MSDDIHALSGAYAVDALDHVERARFERHLAGCSACQAEVESLVAAASELSVLSEASPPASLRAKVLGDIANVRPLPPLTAPRDERGDDLVRPPAPAPEAPTPDSGATVDPAGGPGTDERQGADELGDRRRSRARGLTRGWRLVVAAATVAVLAIGGFTAWRQINTDPSRAIADQVLAAGDATETAKRFPDGSTATVWRSESLHKAVIVTSGMANAPSGKVYQLWLQDPTGHMASAGVMPPGADQVVVLDGDASKAKGAGITLEPAGGSGQPTSDPIALFSFA
ncbi:anti-sigma factor [Terrabacter sp. 2RAF25]|uniref:anti-sigma factor n=1 Tax=Terrabacter sp. 2RAF25 TaxID=3232998 RepID=UPI003F98A0C4